MNQYKSIITVAAICLSSSLVNAQCQNGVCKIPAVNSNSSFTSYKGIPSAFDINRPSINNSACADGRCNITAGCPECGCNGEYCNCGPNCPPHYQSGVQGRSNNPLTVRPLSRGQQLRPSREAYQGTLRAPQPASNRYQAASYSAGVAWMSNYEHGLEASRRSGRPMLVKISAEWCDYCQQMKRQTFTDQGVIRTISNGFVPVELDGDVDRKLIQQLGVRSLPAVVLITPDLRIVDRIEGFKTPQQLTASLLRHAQRAELETGLKVATR